MKAKIAGEEAKDLHLKCPKCDGTLYETEYENVTIDVCSGCTASGSTRASWHSWRPKKKETAAGSAGCQVVFRGGKK